MVEPTTDNRETLDRNHVLLPEDLYNYFRQLVHQARIETFIKPVAVELRMDQLEREIHRLSGT